MSNPLYQELGGNRGDLMNEFQAFMQNMRGKNPHEEIAKMLRSGQISQDQLNRAQQMAQQMQGLFGMFKK